MARSLGPVPRGSRRPVQVVLLVVTALTVATMVSAGPASAAKKPPKPTTTTTVPPTTTTVPPTTTTTVPTTTTTVPPTTTTVPPTTTTTTTVPTTPPAAEATSVLAHGAVADDVGDDTAAFLRAQDAALASTFRHPAGPTGQPQAVVYVPPGTYRLLRLDFRSDVRMEVDAAAVLQQAGGRNIDTNSGTPTLIRWDGVGLQPLANVSLLGVGSSSGGLKSLAGPVFPGWSLDSSFTFHLDPAATDANALTAGLQALHVRGFLIQNVYSIQNDSQPTVAPTTPEGWWPQSHKAALSLRARNDSPSDGSDYYDPHDGEIGNWYNIRSPKGFGPNQVNSAHNVRFSHIFSSGGTTMRFETDASQGKSFGSEVRGVTADDIVGQDCNRAVSFSPHAQHNSDVHVTRVQALGCAEGVIESYDETNSYVPGSFVNSTISDVTVISGDRAQVSVSGSGGLWTVSRSNRAFAKDSTTRPLWSVVYEAGTYRCSGIFANTSHLITTTTGAVRPVCT